VDEKVDKVEPEFGGLAKQEAMNILRVLDTPEDVSDAFLSRFDIFSFILEYGNYAFITLVFQ
jgi:hypothetical protein